MRSSPARPTRIGVPVAASPLPPPGVGRASQPATRGSKLSLGQKDGPWPPPELPPALPPWADPEARADAPLICCSAGLALALTDGEGEELDPAEALAAGLGFAALRDWSDPVVAGAALDADGLADAAADAEAAGLVVGVGLVASAG